jgi:hypothetical protein
MTDPCRYRALVAIPHPTGLGVFEPGTLLIEGSNIPVGWIPPSGDTDPLTEAAVYKVYATVPRLPPAVRSISPKTFWKVAHHSSHDEWVLTGLGSGLSAINM